MDGSIFADAGKNNSQGHDLLSVMADGAWVNNYNRFYAETEVGGYKESGVGRMAGFEGLHEFTQTKH